MSNRKLKENRDIGEICYIIEINEEKVNELTNEVKTIERAILNRKTHEKFHGIKNELLKKKSIIQIRKNLKNNSFTNDICKINIHGVFYCRHLKSRRHLGKISQFIIIVPRKNPIKRVVKEDIKVTDMEVENEYFFTGRIFKIAYDISIDNHHSKHAKSTITITSKLYNNGVDMNHSIRIMEELSNV